MAHTCRAHLEGCSTAASHAIGLVLALAKFIVHVAEHVRVQLAGDCTDTIVLEQIVDTIATIGRLIDDIAQS